MKNRRLSIWVIITAVLMVGLLLWLLLQPFLTPSNSITEYQLIEKLKAATQIENIKIYKISSNSAALITARFYDGEGVFNSIATSVTNTDLFKEQFNDNNKILAKISTELTLPYTLWNFINSLTPFIFPISLILLFFTRLRRMGGIGGFKQDFKGTKLQSSKIMFTDVAGIEEEKKELMEIVDFLKVPKKYIDMGARIPKGLLLYGPPGTGKTLLAKAVSGESKVPFFSVAGSEFEETYVGLGASRIRDLFKNAKKNAPCIVFIDEIDSLASSRNVSMTSTNDQTLNQFLSELDGFEENAGVVIIGATNRFEILDRALLRSGRFDRKIQISLPDVRERKEILRIHSRNKNIAKDVNYDEIAGRTPGFSGAELENSLNEAALLAVRNNKKIIGMKEIDEGLDRVVGGPAKISKIISQKTRTLVAIHEAGHALMGLLVSDAMKVQKVTIIPRGNAGGYTITTPKEEDYLLSKQALTERLIGLLAGRAAETVIFGETQITTGAHDDFSKATILAKKMVEEFGMGETKDLRYFPPHVNPLTGSDNRLSEETKKQLDANIKKVLDDAFIQAENIVFKNKPLLYLIAESLLILETITSSEVAEIYENRQLPKAALDIKIKNPDKKYLDFDLFLKKTTG